MGGDSRSKRVSVQAPGKGARPTGSGNKHKRKPEIVSISLPDKHLFFVFFKSTTCYAGGCCIYVKDVAKEVSKCRDEGARRLSLCKSQVREACRIKMDVNWSISE